MNKLIQNRIESDIIEKDSNLDFSRCLETRRKTIHLSHKGNNNFFCNGTEKTKSEHKQISKEELIKNKNSLCVNCVKIFLSILDKKNLPTKNKKTIKPFKSAFSKHKRLKAHQKSLMKTKKDFLEFIEKTNSTSDSSDNSDNSDNLKETITSALPTLSLVKKAAISNLEKIAQELKDTETKQEFKLVDEMIRTKELIKIVEIIKNFYK
jgi:hypothetical protein